MNKSKTFRLLIFLIIIIAVFLIVYIPSKNENKDEIKVGLIYLVQHPSIDEGLNGFKDEIKKIESSSNIKFSIEYANAFGEIKNINSILNSFKAKKYVAIVALTTPCAQVAKQVIKDKPIIFVGVTDPVSAGLIHKLPLSEKNITGTTSKVPNYKILLLAKSIFPHIKNIGIIYSSSEANSISIINDLEKEISKNNQSLKLIKKTVSNTSEIYPAANSLSNSVNAFLIINDNLVVSGADIIINIADKKNIPVIASDIESVKKGALFTYGLNYRDEGIAAADILKQIFLDDKKPEEIPIYINEKYYLSINEKLKQKYNVDTTLISNAEILR